MKSQHQNIAVLQSGGCTPVINESLWAVVSASRTNFPTSDVYGVLRGVEGLISGNVSRLTNVSEESWQRVRHTPGSALGSTRKKLSDADMDQLFATIEMLKVGYLFLIGGNDTADTTEKISRAGKISGIPLNVIHIPKTIDNDLVETDHSPGYGSAARFIALATMGSGQDALSMGNASPITVIEVMGRDAGWLAMASGLGKRSDQDPPHFIGIPEVPIDQASFIDVMSYAYRQFGYAVAVISENCRGPKGVLGPNVEPLLVDEFGHGYYESPAKYLSKLLSESLNIRVRYEYPGTIQRTFIENISTTDRNEAQMVGISASKAALEGRTDCMVTLLRDPEAPYRCKTGLVSVDLVANRVATVPVQYRIPDTNLPTKSFNKYAAPLIGDSLPDFFRF